MKTERQAGSVCALVALLIGAVTMSAWAAPRFEWLPPTNATWGPYEGFPLVVVTSRFRNAGTKPLRVSNARSTCVCTTLSAAPKELAPGAVGQIIMTTKQEPTLFPTMRTFGYVMTTDDPDQPVVVWSAVAEFVPTNRPAAVLDKTQPSDSKPEEAAVQAQPAEGPSGDAAFFLPAEKGVREVTETLEGAVETTSVYRVRGAKSVYGCALDAEVELLGEDSLVRVVLVDATGQVYLALESYSALHGKGGHTFKRHCEETCVLRGIRPVGLLVQVEQAWVRLARMYWRLAPGQENAVERHEAQQRSKVRQLNEQAGTWRAGLTAQGRLRYAEKCMLFSGAHQNGLVPNVQGMEYYAGGLYTLRTNPPRAPRVRPAPWPPRMNWQARHGYRLLMPVKDQGLYDMSAAYALVGALECNLNIFYNQHVDVTLAEEDLWGCSGAQTEQGFDVARAVQYCYDVGVVSTDCWVQATAGCRPAKCVDWKQHVVRAAGAYLTNNISNDELRRLLVRYGVVPVRIPAWEQMMVVVGWETNAYSEAPVWVMRNSYGTAWGEDGYMRLSCDAAAFAPVVVFTTPYMWGRRQINTVCNDLDGDHYCAWGIAPVLPRNCCTCNCRSTQDFDDMDPQQGPHYPPNL